MWRRRRRPTDNEFRQEIEAHIALEADRLVAEGLGPEEAERTARVAFGSVTGTRERFYRSRRLSWLDDLARDVRFGLRTLRRAPGFSLVSVATLALATGATTALFSIIDAALLRAVPYERPDEIVAINVGESGVQMAPSATDIEGWRRAGDVFADIGMGRFSGLRPVVVDSGIPERVNVGTASEGFLEVFGIDPILGRALTAEDRRPGAPLVVLLGHRYWQTRLNGTPDVLGGTILVGGEFGTIIGVLPAGFYPETMVWRPHVVAPNMAAMRGTGVPVYARLRPGLSIDVAARDLSTRLAAAEQTPELRVRLRSLYEETTTGYRHTIAVLSGAVALILLIACLNVASMLFARGATRQPELAIRKSVGASRLRLVRQLLAESVVLASLGGVGGLILAWVTLDVVVAFMPLSLPENVEPAINLSVLAVALLLSLLTSLVFGLAPAMRSSRAAGSTHLAAGRRRLGSALTRRTGQLLIAVEVAMALVLVVGAGLMLRSFSNILAIDVGFDAEAFLTLEVVPVETDPIVQEAYYLALLSSLRQTPGVAAVGAVDRPPLDGSGAYTSATAAGGSTSIAWRGVLPGYFEAVGLPLQRGRFPTDADYRTEPPFAVLSESAARAIFPEQGAVGQQFVLSEKTWTVVGVVSDAQNRSPLRRDQQERPELYLAHRPEEASPFSAGLTVVIRPGGRIPNLGEHLRRAAEAVGPPVILERVRSGRDWFGERVETPRDRTMMLSLLGGLGLVLALVGIFGTTAYAVARRTREVGVRMALGARPSQVVGAVVRESAWPVAIGILVGLASALAGTRVIASFLFETAPTDLPTFAATALALAVTALLAAWIPARRAAQVDPVSALRAE